MLLRLVMTFWKWKALWLMVSHKQMEQTLNIGNRLSHFNNRTPPCHNTNEIFIFVVVFFFPSFCLFRLCFCLLLIFSNFAIDLLFSPNPVLIGSCPCCVYILQIIERVHRVWNQGGSDVKSINISFTLSRRQLQADTLFGKGLSTSRGYLSVHLSRDPVSFRQFGFPLLWNGLSFLW